MIPLAAGVFFDELAQERGLAKEEALKRGADVERPLSMIEADRM